MSQSFYAGHVNDLFKAHIKDASFYKQAKTDLLAIKKAIQNIFRP